MGKNDNSDGFFMEKKKKTDLTKERLVEFDEDIEEIEIIRREGAKIHIMGYSYGFRIFADDIAKKYHGIYDTKQNKMIQEDFFKRDYGSWRGVSKFFSFIGIGLPFFINHKYGTPVKRRAKTEQYNKDIEKFEKENIKELEDKIKHIKIYKEPKDSVAKDLGVILKYVDTGKQEAFISIGKRDMGWDNLDLLTELKVKAEQLGADAIVSYANGEGTPVKFDKKNGKKR